MLSNDECTASPRARIEMWPLVPFVMLTVNSVPHEPRLASAGTEPASAFVSPVAAKTNVRKPDPGRNWRFSGRSNGVAPAALASALASNGAVPFVAVLWIVIHL